MKRGITHKAIITDMAPEGLLVRIISDSGGAGCAGCAIADVCHMQAPVAVPYEGASPDMVGRTAILRLDAPAPSASMMWLMGIPLAALVIMLCALIYIGLPQGMAALGAIASAAIWYAVVYRVHGKRKRTRTPIYTILEIVQ